MAPLPGDNPLPPTSGNQPPVTCPSHPHVLYPAADWPVMDIFYIFMVIIETIPPQKSIRLGPF